MTDQERCGYRKDDGERCRAPMGLCSSCGFCRAHCYYDEACDYTEEEVRQARAKGGYAAARIGTLRTEELPPLESADAAETWCDVVGRAAATDRISAEAANAALRAVKEWRQARESGKVSDRIEAMQEALSEWRATGDPEPMLELVNGDDE